MAKQTVSDATLKDLGQLAPFLTRMPTAKITVDYDREADVLYVSFRRPQKATDSEMLDDGVLIRYRGDEVVGVTILEASKR
jgi:uncharacterized protein YuzE